ncbi:MAG: hypothetical protein UY03_C0024G0005 [Parcubacteria group bacterium GW2011_GWA2_47_64]|nr:MAG: hypothetical protein UY03_C0024G0005 [Parcubacteria group bacterium GW2011_GWA2_47_64]KKU97026.1 MAG: hypothetical protein UY29_C0003G0023 [Parcubacteria group bacterium GW2011_GWC2_48_17]
MRDSYNAPLEEVILTELIANALDSKATRLDFIADATGRFLRCVDNGAGMKRQQLKEYHNIASSDKVRGQGIGFAGVGAKLSLLLAERVVTESRGGRGSRAATEWRLTNPYRAPWKFIPTSGAVTFPRGTSVTIHFADNQPHLLRKEFVVQTVIKHFYPLFHDHLREAILRFVYRKGIEITVNGELLILPDTEQRVDNEFKVFLGKGRRPIGAGFLTKKVLEQGWLARLAGRAPNELRIASGLSISTYGKVIKTGWEWVGIIPKSAGALCGVVEVPAVSEVLTTNKSDFLTDAAHLRKFYRFRKAIQQAILPVLRSLGEYGGTDRGSATKNVKAIERQIETTLDGLSTDYPELESLLGSRRGIGLGAERKREKHGGEDGGTDETHTNKDNAATSLRNERAEKKKRSGKDGETASKKKPGLTLLLEDLTDAPDMLGRMLEDTVSINTLHPAWKKSLETKQEEYHILVVVGLSLAEFVSPEKHPVEFLAKFLSSWSAVGTGGSETSVQTSLL